MAKLEWRRAQQGNAYVADGKSHFYEVIKSYGKWEWQLYVDKKPAYRECWHPDLEKVQDVAQRTENAEHMR